MIPTPDLERLLAEATPGPWEMRTGEAQGIWAHGFKRLDAASYGSLPELALAAAAPDLAREVLRLREEVREAQCMFAAAIYAQPSSVLKVWPVHLQETLIVFLRDDPLDHSIEFRAALAPEGER